MPASYPFHGLLLREGAQIRVRVHGSSISEDCMYTLTLYGEIRIDAVGGPISSGPIKSCFVWMR